MYKFVRCQPHTKCPSLQGWYLVLEPADIETLMKLHKSIAGFYYHKFGLDPHIVQSVEAFWYNPVRLAGMWLGSIEKYLAAGITLAVNSVGGMIPLDSVRVIAETETPKLIWPGGYRDEVITISRWSKGKHYYLSSNKDRIFVPGKHNTYANAVREAQMYTDNIQDKGC